MYLRTTKENMVKKKIKIEQRKEEQSIEQHMHPGMDTNQTKESII